MIPLPDNNEQGATRREEMTMSEQDQEIVGYIARRDAGAGERWALYFADGTLSNSFAIDADREAVKALLAKGGLVLRDDDKVARA